MTWSDWSESDFGDGDFCADVVFIAVVYMVALGAVLLSPAVAYVALRSLADAA